MRIFNKLLEHMLIEDLPGSPNWESAWWTDVVFRGLQEDGHGELGADSERAESTAIANRELL
jgi:hypothetical protein